MQSCKHGVSMEIWTAQLTAMCQAPVKRHFHQAQLLRPASRTILFWVHHCKVDLQSPTAQRHQTSPNNVTIQNNPDWLSICKVDQSRNFSSSPTACAKVTVSWRAVTDGGPASCLCQQQAPGKLLSGAAVFRYFSRVRVGLSSSRSCWRWLILPDLPASTRARLCHGGGCPKPASRLTGACVASSASQKPINAAEAAHANITSSQSIQRYPAPQVEVLHIDKWQLWDQPKDDSHPNALEHGSSAWAQRARTHGLGQNQLHSGDAVLECHRQVLNIRTNHTSSFNHLIIRIIPIHHTHRTKPPCPQYP